MTGGNRDLVIPLNFFLAFLALVGYFIGHKEDEFNPHYVKVKVVAVIILAGVLTSIFFAGIFAPQPL